MSCFMHFPSPPALQESRVTLWLIHSHHAEMEDALRLQWNHHGSPTISWRWNHVKTMVTIWLFDLPLSQQWQFGWFLGLPLYRENKWPYVKIRSSQLSTCNENGQFAFPMYTTIQYMPVIIHHHPSTSIITSCKMPSHQNHIYIYTST